MLKELEEDIAEVKKTIYEQSDNINKKVENLKEKIWSWKVTKITKMKISVEGFKVDLSRQKKDLTPLKN